MTRRRLILISSFATPGLFGEKKQKLKGPEITISDASVKVEDNRVNIDGKLKNTGDKAVEGLRIYYEVLDSDGNVLTRQMGPAEDEGVLEPGQGSEFHAQIAWHARSISLRFSFEDGAGRDLRSQKTGPFPIE